MKNEIKELRVKIDGLAKLTKSLREDKNDSKFPFNSPECSKAYDSLLFAKAWLGKILGELGNENPYKSGYKTVEDIEPTADVCIFNNTASLTKGGETERYEFFKEWENNKSHIEKVDWLREEIQSIIDGVIMMGINKPSREFSIARTNTYNYLCEARFNLGFELQRIKEQDKELKE